MLPGEFDIGRSVIERTLKRALDGFAASKLTASVADILAEISFGGLDVWGLSIGCWGLGIGILKTGNWWTSDI